MRKDPAVLAAELLERVGWLLVETEVLLDLAAVFLSRSEEDTEAQNVPAGD